MRCGRAQSVLTEKPRTPRYNANIGQPSLLSLVIRSSIFAMQPDLFFLIISFASSLVAAIVLSLIIVVLHRKRNKDPKTTYKTAIFSTTRKLSLCFAILSLGAVLPSVTMLAKMLPQVSKNPDVVLDTHAGWGIAAVYGLAIAPVSRSGRSDSLG